MDDLCTHRKERGAPSLSLEQDDDTTMLPLFEERVLLVAALFDEALTKSSFTLQGLLSTWLLSTSPNSTFRQRLDKQASTS
jgi:hypothetical protein